MRGYDTPCLRCGTLFHTYPSVNARFCSRECAGTARSEPRVRFWEKVDKDGDDGCWAFTGGRTAAGYGMFHPHHGQNVYAHRFAWEDANGPIPDGLFLCHRCDHPWCCNPAHMFLGTAADNNADCTAKGRRPSGDDHWSRRMPERSVRGEAHGGAKLSDAECTEICARYTNGERVGDLAREKGVSHSAVSNIVHGKRRRAL